LWMRATRISVDPSPPATLFQERGLMRIELTVPEVGESISEVQISQWQKAEGDFATEDEILALLETDKATVELRAPSAGALVEVVKKEGELARVGEVVAYLETEAEATK